MTQYYGFAFTFESRLSLDAMLAALNRVGPWQWRGSESDIYGESVWCYAGDAAKLKIVREEPRWLIQVSFLPDPELTPDDIRGVLHAVVFPAISARKIEAAEPVM